MNHLYNDLLLVYPEATIDEYGRQTYGTPTVVKARIVEKTEELEDPKGETIVSNAIAHLPADTEVTIGGKIKHETTYYTVQLINKPKDHSAVRFIKLYLAYA